MRQLIKSWKAHNVQTVTMQIYYRPPDPRNETLPTNLRQAQAIVSDVIAPLTAAIDWTPASPASAPLVPTHSMTDAVFPDTCHEHYIFGSCAADMGSTSIRAANSLRWVPGASPNFFNASFGINEGSFEKFVSQTFMSFLRDSVNLNDPWIYNEFGWDASIRININTRTAHIRVEERILRMEECCFQDVSIPDTAPLPPQRLGGPKNKIP